jgi:polysaccharide pyruvyl transferase CsaB
MRRTVVLAGYYGFGNTGDEAILASILAGLRRRVPGTVFIVVSGDPEATRRQHTVEAIGWRDLPALSASVAKSDAVLVGGGGLFQDYWGLDVKTLLTPRHGEIAFYAGPVVLAALARKPALLYGLGFGPLSSPEARRYARAVADAAVHVSVRDEASRELLLATGVPEARIHPSADPAFALEIPENAPGPADLCRASGVEPRAPILGVALRPWSIGVEQPAWEKEVLGALEGFLAQTGGTILFVPFEKSPWTDKDDFEQASRLAAALSGRGRIVVAPVADDRQPREVAALLAGCDLVLGMRLHSLVFAAAGGVPGVGLAYDPKVTALLSRLGGPAALPLAKATSSSLLDALTRSLADRAGTSTRLRAAAAKQKALAEDDLDRAARLIAEPPPAPEVSRAVLSLFDDALEANRGRASEIEASLSAAKGGLEALERAHAHEKALLEQRLGETRQELARLQGSRLWRLANLYARLRRSAAAFARRILGRPASDWAGPDTSAGAARRAVPMRDESRYDVVWLGRGAEASLPERSRAILAAYAKAGHRVFPVRPEDAGGLDALRRAETLAASAVFVEDPAGLPHARRMRSSRGWLLVDATGEPDHSAEPPDVVLDPAASPEDVLHAIPGFFPKVSIVVVTRENRDLNRLCLESVRARTEWPNFEVLVVDNGSADGTVELLRELAHSWPRLSVIENAENRGFAAAVNQGFAAAATTAAAPAFLVMLNNDTVVTRGWLTALLAHLRGDPKLGLVGPVTNAISNEAQVDIGYRGLAELPAKAAQWVQSHDGESFAIPMLAFFCAALRRQTWEAVGPLDERFGAGMFEDDDWCRRARAQGWEIRCARDAYVHHWQKATFRKLGEKAYRSLYEENRRKYEEKWGVDAAAATAREAPRADLGKYRAQLAALLESRTEAVAAKAVVFLPSIGWGIHLFQRPHHLARAFARAGWLSIFDCSNAQDQVDGFKEVEPNLFLYRGPAGVLERIPAPFLWSFPYNFHQTRAFPSDARVLYDWIDDLSVFPYDRALLEENHARALSDATVVAAVARRLLEEALARRPDALYLPNGVEYERFSAPAAPASTDRDVAPLLSAGRPIAGYYGALAEWFDYELVDETARLRPDWSFLLIGPMYDQSLQGRPMLKRENVRWIGPRDYHLLPGYLALFDVATIPFRINPITTATSPLKLYEYFAGGKPVVTTPMPECAAFPEVSIAGDAKELAAALDPARAKGRDPAFRERLRSLGRENSWDARVKAVLTQLAVASAMSLHAR